MANRNTQQPIFPVCKSRQIQVDFGGGQITSDGGSLLLRQADRRLHLIDRVCKLLHDDRVKGRCDHRLSALVRQRVYALALGYEDLNDHETLRHDIAFQTAVESDQPLASSSTLCRFENRRTARLPRQSVV